MSEFRRIMMSSFLMLLLHFTAAAKRKYSFLTVRAGDEVTLPCDNVKHDQDTCESISWILVDSSSSTGVELVEHGQIGKEPKARSDRLRVTENCSLVIKKVTEEDVGQYSCRQLRSGEEEDPDAVFDLSVVNMTEHQDNDEVTLNCSVKTYRDCRLSVKWLLQGRDVDKDHREIKTSQSSCSASVTFLTSLFSYTTRSELFTCNITDGDTREVQVFPFSPQSSGEDTKPATKTTTTTTTAKNNINSGDDTSKVTTVSPTTTKSTVKMRPALETGWWWWIIVVIVGVAALTIITVAVIRRKRTQGNETQTDDNVADPEDSHSYASISYTRKSSSKARADDDEDDGLTYSTVGAPSSSSAASADPSLLYATVNTPK